MKQPSKKKQKRKNKMQTLVASMNPKVGTQTKIKTKHGSAIAEVRQHEQGRKGKMTYIVLMLEHPVFPSAKHEVSFHVGVDTGVLKDFVDVFFQAFQCGYNARDIESLKTA